MVVDQHLAEQVQGILGAEMLVVGFDELAPWFYRVSAMGGYLLSEHFDKLVIEFQMVLLDILEEIVRTKHLGYLHQLI